MAKKRIINRVIKTIKDIIDTHTYLRLDSDGHYYGEIYADYRDEFDEAIIVKMFKADNPRDMFYEQLDFFDCEWDYRDEVIKTIKARFNDDDDSLDYDEHEDFIRDWITENVYFNHPYDHYLNQDVYIDIIVDTGDANYDFTKNELFGCNYSPQGLEDREESALVWLMQQQGYDITAITDFVENDNMQDSKLFKSIYQECLNTTTCINALAFFVKLSLGEALDLYDAIKNINATEDVSDEENAMCEIVLDKNTPCGLYDSWNGAGSLLGIELEKDVVLPFKHIHSAMPDGCLGYSISSIYGMCHSFWDNGGLTIKAQSNAA